ncbi:hypothetical protein HK104_005228, partial [Borealophlyctis nickersoniae]
MVTNILSSAGLVLTAVAAVSARTITVKNNCNFDVWPGIQGSVLVANGGFALPAHQSRDLQVPDNWSAARIWPRTGCKTVNGRFVCDSGDCGASANNFGVECRGIGGQAPASLAEFTLGSGGNNDFYDLSNVDGYNIGISIQSVGGQSAGNAVDSKFNCGSPQCTMNTGACPAELKLTDSNGVTTCMSICSAVNNANQRAKFPMLQNIFNNPNQKALVCCDCDCGPNCGCTDPRSKFCCSPYNTNSPLEVGGKCRVENWPKASNGQQYDQVFKQPCPDAYSWQFDDHKSTYQCKASNYVITF